MQSIGGYFEWELTSRQAFMPEAYSINTAHNALRIFLENTPVKRIYLPAYLCDVIPTAILDLDISIDTYFLNENWFPDPMPELGAEDVMLYVNYFGLMDTVVSKLVQISDRIIVDQAQALYASAQGLASIYSPRKFLGVPDGGYLVCKNQIPAIPKRNMRTDNWIHLIRRLESGPAAGFQEFKANESRLEQEPIQDLSEITRRILESIDHDIIKARRRANYRQLAGALSRTNRLKLIDIDQEVPMIYPYLTSERGLRQKLQENGIFTAHYWPGLSDKLPGACFESDLVANLVPLPIDQRYGRADMDAILRVMQEPVPVAVNTSKYKVANSF